MKTVSIFSSLLIVALTFSMMSCEKKVQERKISVEEVPEIVLQAFNKAYPGATIKEYGEEIKGVQTFYEISCVFQGRQIDAVYKSDGTVSAIEEAIPVDQLPAVVNQAIAKEFKQSSIKSAEKIEKQGKQLFEVKLLDMKDQKEYELQFSDTGKLIKKEQSKVAEEKKY